jgi:fatty acid desaturase
LLARTFFGLAAGFFAAGFFAAGFFAAGLALVLAMALTFVAFAFGAAPREPRVEAGMFATTNFGSPKKKNWLTG